MDDLLALGRDKRDGKVDHPQGMRLPERLLAQVRPAHREFHPGPGSPTLGVGQEVVPVSP